ncbi:MAG: glyoxalase [Ponticaulis sp.]|nr:glyoxalase [Ponticaulis sp.]
MLGYVMVGTNDMDKALAFYDALMPLMDGKRSMPFPKGQSYVFGDKPAPMFVITSASDGEACTHGNGTMFAFNVKTPEKVAEIHAKALELGASDEGAPGPRAGFGEFAYFRDPDGNKLAVFALG